MRCWSWARAFFARTAWVDGLLRRLGKRLARSWLDEACFVGDDDGLGAVVEVELVQDAGYVGLHGGVRDYERGRDLAEARLLHRGLPHEHPRRARPSAARHATPHPCCKGVNRGPAPRARLSAAPNHRPVLAVMRY